MFKGFSQRLEQELDGVKVAEKPYRGYMSWIGAAILASLSSFESKWISKGDYAEHGPQIIHKKSVF